jgi:hypothetical protein
MPNPIRRTWPRESQPYREKATCKPTRENTSAWIASGTSDVNYLGSGCNCQARITYRGQNVIGLTLGLAC